MKIAVVAANGRAGKLITNELVSRNEEVTAIARSANTTQAQHFIQKDIMDLTAQDLSGFDAVIDAFGAWEPTTLPGHTTTLEHLCDLLSGTDTRLLIVGGAGSLFVDPEHSTMLSETPDFPEIFIPVANATTDAFLKLRDRNDVKWTYLSPAADFQADGKRTGEYILASEELTLNEKGESIISYADYAIAMADEVLSGNHIKERISVVGK